MRLIPKEESTCPAKPYLAMTVRRLHGLILDRLETGVVLAAIAVDEGRVDLAEALVEALEVVVLAVLTADVSRVEIASQSFVK